MAILRRNQHVVKFVGGVVSIAWVAKKEYYMLSGQVERDLSRVTTAKIGSLKDPQYSVPALLKRLKKYNASLYYRVFCMRDSTLAARLNVAIDNLETDVSDGALRKQPFCVMLYGYPGTGKSSFAIQVARALMLDLYGEFNTCDMVTLNETDEYQSEFRTSHKVVLFDDIGASKYGLSDTKNPWRKVIDFVNNIKKTALNPNVEMKGKVYINPDLVILTSNLDFENSAGLINGYIPAFEAIFRRLSKIVRVKDHATVQPLEFEGLVNESQTGYCTRRPTYRPRGGVDTPIDVLREDYIEELREAFRKHNEDQESFLQRFNGYFDDYAEHRNPSCDILVSQSGNSAETDIAEMEEARIQYYIAHVDWERYFIEWYDPLKEDYHHYYLTHEGIVTNSWHNYKDLPLYLPSFNQAYFRIREKSSVESPIKAESKSLRDKLYSDKGDLRSSEYGDRLKEHCLEMTNMRHNLSHLKVRDILHNPFRRYLALTKKCTRVTYKSFYKAYILYMCVDLDVDPATLLADPLVQQHVPKTSWIKREKFVCRMRDEIVSLRKTHPYLFLSPTDDFSDQSESNHSSSVISEITELPDEPTETVSSRATSCATPWLDEAQQIKYILSTVKPSVPCQTIVNAQLHSFGEIDLLYFAPGSILVFELKSGQRSFDKAKDQALRYSRVMHALYPDRRVIGLTHTPVGFNMVCDLNASLDTEFESFLRMIGYLDTTIVVEE